ncbi:MAG: hypothetical protein KAS32_15600 [Candidatus Peribacteraceae bacterium]|nr:hypothetical protein [Candidatus Peribacteraceae bacterium]
MSPVRNLRGIGRPKPIPSTHFIPPRFSPVWKVEVVTDTETIDLSERIASGEFSDGVTDKIGDFIFRIIDPTNDITNRVEEFDTVNVYLDYGTTATTLRFAGKIERESNAEQIYLDISGRSVAMITTGVNITYSSNGPRARSLIISDLIDLVNEQSSTANQISKAGIEDDLTEIDVSYGEIPFWQVIAEICNSAERDAYVSPDLIFNYFERGSRKNSTEAIVESINLVEAFDFAKDTEELVTKVRVYGKSDGNVPIIYSSASDTSQTKGIVKELKSDVGTLLTPSQAKDLAESQAAAHNTAPTLGTITSLMTPTILPGEKIKIANPTNNIAPEYYEINSFRHVFTESGSPETTFTIKKERINTSKIIKRSYNFQNDVTENINPRTLDFSIIYDYSLEVGDRLFDDGVFSNVELEIGSTGDGVLKTITGETGTWTSDEIITDGAVTRIEIRQNSTDLAGTKFFVSLDGGIVFKEIGSDAGDFVFEDAQNSIILRADIKSSNTRINKIGILYNT